MKSLCGLRPSGRLHIGHYFACIQPALAGADLLIATYHAPIVSSTVPLDQGVTKTVCLLERFGVTNVLHQEQVFRPTLYFQLLALARHGELSRMTQFRSGRVKTAHLYAYPVLMTHDVAGYDEVIVGDDQSQHLNFARDLLRRYNRNTGERAVIPVARTSAGRVMNLTDPTQKMSKSEPTGCLFLDEGKDSVASKIKRAVADDAGRANLYDLYQRLGGTDSLPEMNSKLKEMLIERVCTLLPEQV
jgi:tryptophanyl-tRNA synthetase